MLVGKAWKKSIHRESSRADSGPSPRTRAIRPLRCPVSASTSSRWRIRKPTGPTVIHDQLEEGSKMAKDISSPRLAAA